MELKFGGVVSCLIVETVLMRELSIFSGFVICAAIAGMVGFLCLLFPATSPDIYNDRMDNCRCWQRYCSWN